MRRCFVFMAWILVLVGALHGGKDECVAWWVPMKMLQQWR
jgi:hypothetical protein